MPESIARHTPRHKPLHVHIVKALRLTFSRFRAECAILSPMKKPDYATFGGNVSRVPARSAGRARILPATAFAQREARGDAQKAVRLI